MASTKFDIVIEAVHYSTNRAIEWVRAYERRGSTYSDRIKLTRDELLSRIQAGKKVCAGERVPLLASTFHKTQNIQLVQVNGKTILLCGEATFDHDHLTGVPVL